MACIRYRGTGLPFYSELSFGVWKFKEAGAVFSGSGFFYSCSSGCCFLYL